MQSADRSKADISLTEHVVERVGVHSNFPVSSPWQPPVTLLVCVQTTGESCNKREISTPYGRCDSLWDKPAAGNLLYREASWQER
jgi:hypothetical protein